MSMISAQIDRLRELATRYDELQVGAVKAVTMPSDMGSILRDAADTIWQLRDDLQRANDAVRDAEHDESRAWDRVRKAEADNAKLREIIADLEELLPESGRWYSHETVKAISEDNAKLRKLLLDVWNDAMQFDGFWDYVNDDGEIYNEDELPHYYDRMRGLGLEVE